MLIRYTVSQRKTSDIFMTNPQSCSEKPPACTQHQVEITAAQLPLACPPADQRLWDAYPRVYLPIVEAGGAITCPYCGTHYHLTMAIT